MATHILSLTCIFILFLIPANGRSSLQKPQNVHHLKAISRTSSDSYVTNYTDVLSLGIFTSQYYSLQSDGDPCVDPVWDWIECNSDSRPRVIALNLNSQDMYGELPDFTSMDALLRIDLSQNSLDGSIPSFLGTFPNLQELNLANNRFSGTIPASICNNKNLKLTVFGNPSLTTTCSTSTSNKSPSPPGSISGDSSGNGDSGGSGDRSGGSSGGVNQIPSTKPKGKSNTPMILGVISAFVILGVVVGGFAIHRHRVTTAVAIAQASTMPAGPTDPYDKMPTDEVPMNVRSS